MIEENQEAECCQEDCCCKDKDCKDEEVVDSKLEKEDLKEGQKDLDTLKSENQKLNEQYLRMTADFQNYKKRTEKEKSDIYQFANEKLIVDLLPVVDNFERALQSFEKEGKDESFLEGTQMILKQIMDALKKHGVKEIEALEKEFDPNFHHAVMQEPSSEYESNMIIDVFQKGYMLNEKVIRPSMVKVVQ